MNSSSDYLRRAMANSGLTSHDVSETARLQGHEISTTLIDALLAGNVLAPKLSLIVPALAAGLGRSQQEVFEAFRRFTSPSPSN